MHVPRTAPNTPRTEGSALSHLRYTRHRPTAYRLQCSGCKVLKYCSQHCQKEHWLTGHRKLCKVLAGTQRLEPLRHEVNSCLACTEQAHGEKCSSIRHRKEIVWNYFRFFGCQVGKKPGKDESEFPWHCPFQLGECTGRFVNWIDESLWRLISLLRLTLRAEEKTLKKNSEFPQALDKLERAFWSLRNRFSRVF